MANQLPTSTRGARLGFFIHLAVFLLVNAALAGINFATSTTCLWFKWPLMGWGVGLIIHAVVVFARGRGRAA